MTDSRATVAEVISSRSFRVAQNFTCISFVHQKNVRISKIKGITLNYKNSLILNFNNIKKLIIENERERREAKEKTERSTKFAFYCNLLRRTA